MDMVGISSALAVVPMPEYKKLVDLSNDYENLANRIYEWQKRVVMIFAYDDLYFRYETISSEALDKIIHSFLGLMSAEDITDIYEDCLNELIEIDKEDTNGTNN